MVGQARDQLESNESKFNDYYSNCKANYTQFIAMEEIREVFDGSCDLIPLKPIKKECKRLADDFIPELVEALASQMNPQVSKNYDWINHIRLQLLLLNRSFVPLLGSATTLRSTKCWRSTVLRNSQPS